MPSLKTTLKLGLKVSLKTGLTTALERVRELPCARDDIELRVTWAGFREPPRVPHGYRDDSNLRPARRVADNFASPSWQSERVGVSECPRLVLERRPEELDPGDLSTTF